MRGADAKEVCPQIHLVQVPVARGKADLNTYRNAGSEVVSILARKGRCERASIDEVYLDLTDSAEAMLRETPPESLDAIDEEALKSHILGLKSENGNDAQENVSKWLRRTDANHQDKLLACGALIVTELRMEVLKETQFTCSAGIAHNKMLAKLVSGMNKPAQQTVVPSSSVKGLLESLPVKKMKQLGGKLGTSLQTDLGVNTIGDLLQFSEEKLQELYGINTGGINGEEVQGRLLPKSHGAGKSFPGPRALKTIASVQHWLNQLCDELNERICFDLDQNKRIAHTLTIHASTYKSSDSESHKKFPSKSCPLRYGTAKIQEDAFNLFQAGLREYIGSYGVKTLGHHHNGWGVTALSISASKIVAIPSKIEILEVSKNPIDFLCLDDFANSLIESSNVVLRLVELSCGKGIEACAIVDVVVEEGIAVGTGSITKYFHGQYTSPSSSKETLDCFVKEAMPSSPLVSESYSKLEPTDQLQLENNVPCLGQQEQKSILWKDQDSSCSSTVQTQDGCGRGASPPLPSGSESCLLVNQTDSQGAFRDNPRIDSTMPTLERHKRKINPSTDKGTILKFLKSYKVSCSTPKQENVEMVKGSQSPNSRCSEANQVELPRQSFAECSTNDGSYSLDENAQRAWNYKIDEIDQSIINELPSEIQDEIRAWLQARQRPSIAKRPIAIKRGSIAHYFSPAKNT
ncbi:unnamed protein product [Dovyalis caffra]|uniref:DNA polymerase eta n=1 Tax=Dovyalis caffra TaxID=77055 RepID=A0AAV1RKM1_9ROSI|nr:unnamed protein product [Dovyalis caffra]